MRCLRKNDALCRGTIASIVLLLAQCIGGDDGASQAVCRAGDMRAECGMTLVVHQPGKSLLPFVADEVKMRKRDLDMCLDVWKYTSMMTLFNAQSATRLSEKRVRKRERRGEIGNKEKGKVETNTHARTTARMYARKCHACVCAHRHKQSTHTHTYTHHIIITIHT